MGSINSSKSKLNSKIVLTFYWYPNGGLAPFREETKPFREETKRRPHPSRKASLRVKIAHFTSLTV